MKTFALSLIFSLVVILCEQQTLFAPHYTDFGGRRIAVSKAPSAALPWHRGIPAPNESMLNTANDGLSDTVDGLIAIIALVGTETGIIDPYYHPKLDTGPIDPAAYRKLDTGPIDPAAYRKLDTGPIDPIDYRSLGGQEGEELVDLWFELVDAGYTEDEAFEMIESVTPTTKPE
ncbi:MAG: hypothetical protein MK102_09735 [Fuerstiella sp.]|nr:hypothetical protein [Fuerstiella sp.]